MLESNRTELANTLDPMLEKTLAMMSGENAMPPTVAIDNVSIRYGSTRAIENASFIAHAGQVLALVGPSGCGKSSLLFAINRMTDTIPGCQVNGKVYLNNVDVSGHKNATSYIRQRVGMVFQQANPFPLSIAENICFPLKDHGLRNVAERESIMQDVLEQTGLWPEVKDRLKQNALALSGGQQQRLCFARALALNPQVLLLDEPCSALDPVSTEKIERLISELKGRVTMILVTHNLAQARRVADQVAVCWVDKSCGCVVECAETKTIFERPMHPVTKDYCMGRLG